MKITTVTQKGQATIPADVRKQLDLHPGDKIYFETVEGYVVLRKIQSLDYEHHYILAKTLSEWTSKKDNEAYDDL